MKTQLIFVGMSLVVLVGMVAFQMLGRQYATRRPHPPCPSAAGVSAIEASVFALLGLLVAFSFSGAETRLQARRDLVVREADAIGTAYLRLDLLPADDRAALKEELRRYTESRVVYYEELLDRGAARAGGARSEQLQRRIWAGAVRALGRAHDPGATMVVVQALNEMFDVTTARTAALRMHIPLAIFAFLVVLSFACAFVAGMNMAPPDRSSTLHVFLFAATMALTAYVILNVEFPRAGFMRMQFLDDLLAQVRASMT